MSSTILLDGVAIPTMGRCAGRCGRQLISQRRWLKIPVGERDKALPSHVQHRARGLCPACYYPLAGTDNLLDYARRIRTVQEFVEEYEVLGPSGEGLTLEAMAGRLGVTPASVKSALHRARKKDLL